LVLRVTALHSQYYNWTPRIAEDDPEKFVAACLSMAGAEIMVTPREIIRDYIHVLNILYQNPTAEFSDIVKSSVTLTPAGEDDENIEAEVDADNDGGADAAPEARRDTGRNFNPEDIIL
ncbi:MAG: ATP-binding protein, partial [Clostridia bacterium]|nr:ATP-binding protein [Clostridia bacterium]